MSGKKSTSLISLWLAAGFVLFTGLLTLDMVDLLSFSVFFLL